MQKLDEKQILTNPTRQAIFNSLMQGYNLREAAEKAKKNYKYVRNLVANSGINDLVLQKKAEIGEKCGVTVEYCQNKLLDLAKTCEAKGKHSVAKSCYDSLLKTIGGFQADAPSDKAVALKQIDSDAKVRIAEALGNFYSDKYLASKSVESHEVISAA